MPLCDIDEKKESAAPLPGSPEMMCQSLITALRRPHRLAATSPIMSRARGGQPTLMRLWVEMKDENWNLLKDLLLKPVPRLKAQHRADAAVW